MDNFYIFERYLASSVQALKDWYVKKPDLFKRRVYKQVGLDAYAPNMAKPQRL